ncbi:MAG: hypothetical protein JXA50_01765 [Deltaproteobacteria bacterium]|nr:hypothetical protein [Deltaproteobacteria bacterium]
MRDLGNEVKTLMAVKPQNQSGDGAVTGEEVDRLGFENCVIGFNAGAATGTPSAVAIACKLQECATSGGSFTDISGATVTIDAESQHKQLNVKLAGVKRYIKAVMTVAFTGGSSPTIDVGASIVLGNAKEVPVS